MKFRELFGQITYVIILVLTILMVASLFYVNREMRIITNDNEQRQAWQTLNSAIKKTDSFFDRNEMAYVEMSKFVSLLENDTASLYRSLTQLLENNRELRATFIHFYDSIKKQQAYLVREENQIQRTVLNDYISEMKQKSLQEHFGKNKMRPFWENPTISIADNQACINLFVPFSDKSNRLKGFIGFNMSLKWIDAILSSSLTYYEKDPHAFMFMLSPDGSAISVAGDIIDKNQNLIEVAKLSDDDIFTSMLYNMRNGETESAILKSDFIGAANMIFYQSLTMKKLSIALSFHENQSVNAWNWLFIIILCVLFFFFTIITLWLWWYWKKRAEMVEKMEEMIYSIGIGSQSTILPSSTLHQDLHGLCNKISDMQRKLDTRKTKLLSVTEAAVKKEHERELSQTIRSHFYSPFFQFYDVSLSDKIDHCIKYDYLPDLGGDFHDYFHITSQQICFVTGTVSRPKKSISNIQTSIDTLMTMNLIRSHFKAYSTLGQCVFNLNNDLYSQNNGDFTVRAFIGIINCETGDLDFVSAGAPPPHIIAHRSIFSFPIQHGLPLASRPNEEYAIGKRELSSGDMLLTYTEGVLSRQNINSESYGQIRLQQAMKAVSMMNPSEFLEKIVENITEFTARQSMQVDDYTLFAIKYENK